LPLCWDQAPNPLPGKPAETGTIYFTFPFSAHWDYRPEYADIACEAFAVCLDAPVF